MSEKKINYYQQLILWELSQKPGHSTELAERCDVSKGAIVTNLRKLKKAGLIHEVGIFKTTGVPARIWSTLAKPEKPNKLSKSLNVGGPNRDTYLKVRSALSAAPMTAKELVSFLGGESTVIRSCLAYWRKGPRSKKHFRISSWQYGVKGYVPVYCVGVGGDAVKPPPLPKNEVLAKWRKKNRADLRIKTQQHKRKKIGATDAINPFAQLLHVTGSTLIAAKQKAKEVRAA